VAPAPAHSVGMWDLTPASLDFLGRDEDLIEELRHQTHAPPLGPGEPGRGADASDSIRVTVDDRGRVHDVEISWQWRRRPGPGRFAESLFEAYTEAVRRATTAAALAALSGRPGRRDDPAPVAPPAEPADEARWRAQTWAALEEIGATLHRLDAAAREDNPTTVRSPHGCLTAELRGGAIAAIHGDPALIAGLDVEWLRQDALAVLRAAEPADRPDERGRRP
jgi:hypothetical protein